MSKEISKSESKKLGILYQSLKRQIKDFYMIVDAFKANNLKRPYELDYTKMKKMARDGIEGKKADKKPSKPSKNNKDSEEDEQPKKVEPVNNEVDLLGFDDPEPVPQPKLAEKSQAQKMDLNDMDLLGGDDLLTNQNNNQPPKGGNNMDLLGIDLFVGNGNEVKVDMDDDDFFDMLANRKEF